MREEGTAILEGITTCQKTGCGNMYVTLNSGEGGGLAEIFCSLGKSGGCARHWTELFGRTLSSLITADTDLESLKKTLKGIKCQEPDSCADAISNALEYFINVKVKKEL